MKNYGKTFAKKLVFYGALFFLVIIILELLSYTLLAFYFNKVNVNSALRREKAKEDSVWVGQQPTLPNTGGVDDEIVHPYFGYVSRHRTPKDPYGFRNSISPVQKKGNEKVIVAVLGGSVAEAMYRYGINDLITELQKNPKFKNKEIVPVNLAIGGYKQPQQLMVINYFLSVGAEFDIVINLDGFNEVTMPLTENRLMKVSSGFPREWRTRTDPLEPWAFKPILMMRIIKEIRFRIKRTLQIFPLSQSYTATALWQLIDDLLYAKLYQYHKEYFYEIPAKDLIALGPYREFVSEEELYHYLSHIWMKASQNIAVLASANQFEYYHFLQPNLHLDGTKPWSEVERKYREGDSPYPKPVKLGYEHLKEHAEEFLHEGERFYDITDVFKKYPQTMYEDDCCHLKPLGSKILAQEIGRIIAEDSKPLA